MTWSLRSYFLSPQHRRLVWETGKTSNWCQQLVFSKVVQSKEFWFKVDGGGETLGPGNGNKFNGWILIIEGLSEGYLLCAFYENHFLFQMLVLTPTCLMWKRIHKISMTGFLRWNSAKFMLNCIIDVSTIFMG